METELTAGNMHGRGLHCLKFVWQQDEFIWHLKSCMEMEEEGGWGGVRIT